jgi:transposase
MRIETQPQDHPTATAAEPATLLVSFELSQSKWVLSVRAPGSAKLSRFTVSARDREKVLSVLSTQCQQVERRTGRRVRIVSIYEAGLDGFWLHRWLETHGVESHVVDAASILGPQRRRKAKTDRIDGEKLLRSLAAWLGGEAGVCSMVEREQGISKAGNRRLRAILIELAWSWQRHQPDSTLTQWFHKRIKGQSGRVKRIAIVALARKLLIALWRYVKHGAVPQGAGLKAA